MCVFFLKPLALFLSGPQSMLEVFLIGRGIVNCHRTQGKILCEESSDLAIYLTFGGYCNLPGTCQRRNTFSSYREAMETPTLFHLSCTAAVQRSGWHFVRHFLMLSPSEQEQAASTQINVAQNWFEELKRRVPAKQ
jgi:hypothetical protein